PAPARAGARSWVTEVVAMVTAAPVHAQTPQTPAPRRSSVPQQLDPADFAQLEPLYRDLLDRPADTPERLEKWEANTARRLRDRERIEDVFEKQLPLRERIALNAGLGDYRAWAWK